MRTISDIKQEITTAWMNNTTVISIYNIQTGDTFDSRFSKVSIESILFQVVATSIWVLESLFTTHQEEIETKILSLKPHTLYWYATKSKKFQFGSTLITGSDTYDNSNLTDDEIESKCIVKYAAVSSFNKQLLIKVAKLENNDLAALTLAELTAFTSYMSRIKDAGVFLNITSQSAEQLKLSLDIYYNPELMDSTGAYLDGSSLNPVETAIKQHLIAIDFDGELILAKLVDTLQTVAGVEIPHITLAQYRYGTLPWTNIDVVRRPYSGYIRIADSDLSINYIPR